MTTGHITAPRTLLARERGEIAAFLREHREDMGEERIAELLDFCELHGSAISIRDGAELFLTGDSWGADLFAPRTEGAT